MLLPMRSQSLTKSLAGVALAFTMLAPAAMLAAQPAGASSPANVSTAVTNSGGNQNPSINSGDTVNVVQNGQVANAGSGMHTITSCFNSANGSLNTGTVKAPTGYSIQYSTNGGSTWSTKLPRNPDLVNCIRAVGYLNSGGLVNGNQAYTATGNLNPPSSVGQITLTGGGDGFNTFFDPSYLAVFNIYHHNSPSTVDCHLLLDGSQCPGFPISLHTQTNHRPYGVFTSEDRMWVAGGSASTGYGFDCIDFTAGQHCTGVGTNGFVTVASGSSAHGQYNNLVESAKASGKVFAYDSVGNKLLCLDSATEAACSGMPTGGYATGLSAKAGYPWPGVNSDMTSVGTKVFVTDGASQASGGYTGGKVYCFDASTMATCSGSWPKDAAGPRVAPTLTEMGFGQAGICTLGATSQCYGTDGTDLGGISGLDAEFSSTLSAAADDSIGDSGVMSTVTTQGSRYYWSRGNWFQPTVLSAAVVDCYDFATNARCAHFPITAQHFLDVNTNTYGSAYAVEADPHVPNCIWTNDNYANILSWDTSTGTNQCKAATPTPGGGEPSKFQNPVSKAIGTMSCDGQPDNNAWSSATIKSPLQNGKVGHLYVSDSSGNAISGWQDVTATVTNGVATYDLSTLDINETGPNPRFEFQSTDLGPNAKVHMTLSAVGSSPELCYSVTGHVVCPSVKALDNGASVEGATDYVTGTVDFAGNLTNASGGNFDLGSPNLWDCVTNPAAPRIQKILPGDAPGSVKLSFNAAPHFGGLGAINSGYYWATDNGSSGWLDTLGGKQVTLTDLPLGYTCFHMQTANDYGWSNWSNEWCLFVPGLPTQPYFTDVTWANSTLTFYWNPPYETGGANVTYRLDVLDSSSNVVKSCTTKKWTCTIVGLKNANGYAARVRAMTKYGNSDWDYTEGSPAGPIGQPTNVTWTATGDKTQLNLAWTAPIYYSGDALNYYRVCAYDGGSEYACWDSSTESVTAYGLQPKVRYAFIVYAIGQNGNTKGSPIFYHRGQ